MREDTASIAAG